MNALRASADGRPTRVRYRVLGMLFVTVVINYLDRSNLSVAAPQLSGDLGLNPFQQGLILSAFGWAYTALQIPGGWLVDRIGPRTLYGLICALWSLATLLQGFAAAFLTLFGLRLLVGTFEAPSYPTCNKLVTSWFPEQERAGAIACYTSGQFVGLAFLTPALVFAQARFGWHSVFILTGLAGLVWAAVWFWLYRDPSEDRSVNELEIQYIQAGGGLANAMPRQAPVSAFRWSDLGEILSSRKLWGIYIGQFCMTSTMWFFLTWFPTYLVQYRHLSFLKVGFLTCLPFLAAFCGILCSGFLSDLLIKGGVSPTSARKAPIIAGLLLSVSIIGANYVNRPSLIILFLTLAGFGNGFASITWVLVSSLAPKRLLGLTGGVFNFFGNLPSVMVPIIVGLLIRGENFAPALVYIAALALAGALSYLFLVGRVERAE